MRRALLAIVVSCGACALFTDLSTLTGNGDASVGDASASDSSEPDASPGDASLDAPGDGAACAALGFVQSASNGELAPTVTTVATTLTSPLVPGDYLAVGLNYEGACGAVASLTDTGGQTFEQLAKFDSSSGALVLETWGAHVTAAASDTITAQFTSACDLRDIKVVEVRGVDPALAAPVPSASQKGNSGVPDASITTDASAILFAHTGDQQAAIAVGAGWTGFLDAWETVTEYEIVGEAGAYSVTYSPEAGEDWAILAVALRACK